MTPLVTIIIPTYNREKTIEETLSSVFMQTYINWECLIIDDGSTDKTFQVVSKFVGKDNRFRWYVKPSKKPKGPSSSRNYGLEKANGEFVVFLDSDDLLANTCLENRICFALKNLKYDFWVFNTKMFIEHTEDENKIFNKTNKNKSDTDYLNEFLTGKYPFCVIGPLWKKEDLLKLNGFDEELIIFEDPDLHIRAFVFGLKPLVCDDIKYDNFYRISNLNKFDIPKHKKDKIFDSMLLFYLKFYPKFSKEIKININHYFKNLVFLNSNFSSNFKHYINFSRHGLFTLKQIILIPMLIFFKSTGIFKLKRIGMHKLIKYTFK